MAIVMKQKRKCGHAHVSVLHARTRTVCACMYMRARMCAYAVNVLIEVVYTANPSKGNMPVCPLT